MKELRKLCKTLGLNIQARKGAQCSPKSFTVKGNGVLIFKTFKGRVVAIGGIDDLTDDAWSSVHKIAHPLSTGGWSVHEN